MSMRKILFRGQRISDNSWVYGNLIFRNHPNADEAIPAIHVSNKNTDIFVEESTVGQFTGVWDKDGNPIFEGDIVVFDNGRMCAVIWFESPEYCGFDLLAINEEGVAPARAWDKSKLRVIGNVHEESNTEPAVPQEMSAREYLKEKARMKATLLEECKKRVQCRESNCHICQWSYRDRVPDGNFERENPQQAVAIVEKWAREHPEERSEE